MRSLIDILSPHFEYLKLLPHFHLGSMVFLGSPASRRPILRIHPNNVEKKYEIMYQLRHQGETAVSFIADGDNTQLVNELRLFLEAETL